MNDELVGLIRLFIQTLQARIERRVFLLILKRIYLPKHMHPGDLLDMVEKDIRAFHQRVELKFGTIFEILARETKAGQVFDACRFRPLSDTKHPHRSPNIHHGEWSAVSGAPPPMSIGNNGDMIRNSVHPSYSRGFAAPIKTSALGTLI